MKKYFAFLLMLAVPLALKSLGSYDPISACNGLSEGDNCTALLSNADEIYINGICQPLGGASSLLSCTEYPSESSPD